MCVFFISWAPCCRNSHLSTPSREAAVAQGHAFDQDSDYDLGCTVSFCMQGTLEGTHMGLYLNGYNTGRDVVVPITMLFTFFPHFGNNNLGQLSHGITQQRLHFEPKNQRRLRQMLEFCFMEAWNYV